MSEEGRWGGGGGGVVFRSVYTQGVMHEFCSVFGSPYLFVLYATLTPHRGRLYYSNNNIL